MENEKDMEYAGSAYIGTKTVRAIEMEKSDAESLLNRTIQSQDGEELGYLVTYEDGYRSWSPKTVFDKAYKLAETHVDRLHIEVSDVTDRLRKLNEFIASPKFSKLSEIERDMMKDQRSAMEEYVRFLNLRIDLSKVSDRARGALTKMFYGLKY